MNIIADVAGRFDELILLVAQMPKDEPIVLVGDLVDRGPKSPEVVNWAMNTPNVTVIKGNHEDMFVDWCENTKRYDWGIWLMNGGNATLAAYNGSDEGKVPDSHVQFLKSRPLFVKEPGLFISHAPWQTSLKSEEIHLHNPFDILWNREHPSPIEGIFQIFGHNSSMKQYGDYAICIDDCSNKRLAGIHWPTKKIYFQDYLDIKW